MRFSRSARRTATRSIFGWLRRPIAICARWSRRASFATTFTYRLNASAIFIPPLRERREAIPAFIGYFIEQYNRLFDKNVSEISRRAIEMLCAYQWPGNVRELSNAIESAVILSENNAIVVSDLPEQIVNGTGAELLYPHEETSGSGSAPAQAAYRLPAVDFGGEPPGFLLDDVIKKTLVRSLEETEGNRRRAADLLGVSRSTLYRMLTRYGIAENPHRASRPAHALLRHRASRRAIARWQTWTD